MSSRFERAYRVGGDTKFNAEFWNRIMRDLDTRLVGIEGKKADFEEAEKTLLDLGLRRINETLLPAAEKIFRVAELGFLVASSDEETTLVEGQNASLTIRAGDQRDLFTPSPFIALTRRSTTADYAIARTIAYDPDSGVLLFDVETVVGNGGPHDDWDVAALAGSVMAMVAALDETRSLRQGTAQDAEAADQSASDAEDARDVALGAASDANDAKGAAEAALLSFLTIYRGASATPPANGEQGHFYFDTDLQQARVYTATGWAPLFSVSLGGVRQDHIEAADGQTNFTVAGGGFTFINVFKNGVLLSLGTDYSVSSPDFTLTTGAAEGDVIAYLAYFATDQTDFYTKENADGRFVRVDSEQGLEPEEQAQARANIDAVSRAGDTITGRLTLDSTLDGLVLSRLTTTQRDAVSAPVKGLVIYNTDEDDLQVYDGAAWLPILSVGSGQTYHDVTSSRSAATNYTNNTGRPMFLSVFSNAQSGNNLIELLVNGSVVQSCGAVSSRGNIAAVIPPGATYRINITGIISIAGWWEVY